MRKEREVNFILSLFIYIPIFAVILLNLLETIPTLEYRTKYNSQKEFYTGLKEPLPANSTLLGMDNCMIASYYSGFDCIVHPVDPDKKVCREFLDKIKGIIKDKKVYLIPDFFAYDSKGMLRKMFFDEFDIEKVYSKLFEDYHRVTYGKSTNRIIKKITDIYKGCKLSNREKKTLELIPDLPLEFGKYTFNCNGQKKEIAFIEYKGKYCFLHPDYVYEVKKKQE